METIKSEEKPFVELDGLRGRVSPLVAPTAPPPLPPVAPAVVASAPEESAARTALRAIKVKLDTLKRQFDAGSKSDIDAGGAALGAISAELQAAIDVLA